MKNLASMTVFCDLMMILDTGLPFWATLYSVPEYCLYTFDLHLIYRQFSTEFIVFVLYIA